MTCTCGHTDHAADCPASLHATIEALQEALTTAQRELVTSQRDTQLLGACVDRLRRELDTPACSVCGVLHHSLRGGRLVVVRPVCSGGCVS